MALLAGDELEAAEVLADDVLELVGGLAPAAPDGEPALAQAAEERVVNWLRRRLRL